MYFFIATLGCKVNQYESQVILEAWERLGHSCAVHPDGADVIVIHSCAVTRKALADLRKTVSALHRAAPRASIIISGCAAQTHSSELVGLDGVFRVIGLAERSLILAGPEALLTRQTDDYQQLPESGMLAGLEKCRRARAQVKIQDGCSHKCTYCIVPLARGSHQSRSPETVISEIRSLLRAGFREVSLIGINLRLYGRDMHPCIDLWDLVGLLDQTFASQWANRARFRITSLDPSMLGSKALDIMASSRMLCPHLHLALQSGSGAILRQMGRGHYDPGLILPFCAELAGVWPIYALGADLLTGFPGENSFHFQETLDLCSALPLSYAHVFPYSQRPGTLAAMWPNQIPVVLRRERASQLRELARHKSDAFLQKMLPIPELVMVVESRNPGRGKCEFYVDCQLEGQEDQPISSRLLRVKPLRIDSGLVTCRVR